MCSVPSLVRAMARTCVYCSTRMRVSMSARPLRRVKVNTAATGEGLLSTTSHMRSMDRASDCGKSAWIVTGTTAASCARAGISSATTPSPGAIGSTEKRSARTLSHTGEASSGVVGPADAVTPAGAVTPAKAGAQVPSANATTPRPTIPTMVPPCAGWPGRLLLEEAALPRAGLQVAERCGGLAGILEVAHRPAALPRDRDRVGDGRELDVRVVVDLVGD